MDLNDLMAELDAQLADADGPVHVVATAENASPLNLNATLGRETPDRASAQQRLADHARSWLSEHPVSALTLDVQTVRGTREIAGWTTAPDGWRRVPPAIIKEARNTNAATGDPLPPERGVTYI